MKYKTYKKKLDKLIDEHHYSLDRVKEAAIHSIREDELKTAIEEVIVARELSLLLGQLLILRDALEDEEQDVEDLESPRTRRELNAGRA